MKVTKAQLRQIIKEEKAKLLSEVQPLAEPSHVDYGMLKDAKSLLMTVIANLQDIGGSSVYGDGDDEIMEQLELLYDINNSLASVLGVQGGTPR
tara:strand:- start:792 stop:1073 length:282 start_codon:yes stop_codon:yes gene_type:complete